MQQKCIIKANVPLKHVAFSGTFIYYFQQKDRYQYSDVLPARVS